MSNKADHKQQQGEEDGRNDGGIADGAGTGRRSHWRPHAEANARHRKDDQLSPRQQELHQTPPSYILRPYERDELPPENLAVRVIGPQSFAGDKWGRYSHGVVLALCDSRAGYFHALVDTLNDLAWEFRDAGVGFGYVALDGGYRQGGDEEEEEGKERQTSSTQNSSVRRQSGAAASSLRLVRALLSEADAADLVVSEKPRLMGVTDNNDVASNTGQDGDALTGDGGGRGGGGRRVIFFKERYMSRDTLATFARTQLLGSPSIEDDTTAKAWVDEQADLTGEKAARGERIEQLMALMGGKKGRDETKAARERRRNREDAESRQVESLSSEPMEGAPKYNEL
jgi:hypothetical protein